jgi:hypothetical protein
MEVRSAYGNKTDFTIQALPVYDGQPAHVMLFDGLNHSDTLHQDTTLDMTYFRDQKAFLDTLLPEERLILKSYTYYGDGLINTMMRGGWTPASLMAHLQVAYTRTDAFKTILGPLDKLNEENCMARVTTYIERFQTVFNKVPVLTKPLRLFRGINPNEAFNPGVQEMSSPTMDYLSTTYDPIYTLLNSYVGKECCAYEFIVHPGVRALWIEPISKFPGEAEIVIDRNVIVVNGCRNTKTLLYKDVSDEQKPGIQRRDVRVVGYDILAPDAEPPPLIVDTALGFGRHIYNYLCSTRGGKRRKTKRRSGHRRQSRRSGRRIHSAFSQSPTGICRSG